MIGWAISKPFTKISIGRSSINVFRNNTDSLEYLKIEGTNPDKVVLLFHGYGADAHDLVSLAQIDSEATWIFPNGPMNVSIAPGFDGHAWFPVDIEALQLAALLGEAEALKRAFPTELKEARSIGLRFIEELSLPLSNLYLGGFSQGAVLATEIAFNLKETPKGLMVLSGTLINEESWKKKSQKRKGMSFFQSHGKSDPLLPFERAKKLENLFLNAGLKGEMYSFDGGHTIPDSIVSNLMAFLESRSDAP